MSKFFDLLGVTEEEYLQWCKDNHHPYYSTDTKRKFFNKIQGERVVRDKTEKKIRKVNRSK